MSSREHTLGCHVASQPASQVAFAHIAHFCWTFLYPFEIKPRVHAARVVPCENGNRQMPVLYRAGREALELAFVVFPEILGDHYRLLLYASARPW